MAGEGSRGLRDDAAELVPKPDHSLVITSNHGDETFSTAQTIPLDEPAERIRIGRLNDDDVPDVLVLRADRTVVQLLSNP